MGTERPGDVIVEQILKTIKAINKGKYVFFSRTDGLSTNRFPKITSPPEIKTIAFSKARGRSIEDFSSKDLN